MMVCTRSEITNLTVLLDSMPSCSSSLCDELSSADGALVEPSQSPQFQELQSLVLPPPQLQWLPLPPQGQHQTLSPHSNFTAKNYLVTKYVLFCLFVFCL